MSPEAIKSVTQGALPVSQQLVALVYSGALISGANLYSGTPLKGHP